MARKWDLICGRGILLGMCERVGVVVSNRRMPALSCVQLTAEDGKLSLVGTNLSATMATQCKDESVKGEGKWLINHDRLLSLLRASAADEVKLRAADGVAELAAGRSRYKLPLMDLGEYPAVENLVKRRRGVKADGQELHRALTLVSSVTVGEAGRYALNGVQVIFDDAMLRLWGTDGRRLVRADVPTMGGHVESKPVILSPECISGLLAMTRQDGPVELAVVGGQLVARAGGVTLSGSLLEGAFPNCDDMVPTVEKALTVSKDDLSRALRQAEVVTTDETRAVQFHLKATGMTLRSRSSAYGECEVELDCTWNGPDGATAFHPRFLLDALRVWDGEEVTLMFTKRGLAEAPMVIEQEGRLTVVAPVRMREER